MLIQYAVSMVSWFWSNWTFKSNVKVTTGYLDFGQIPHERDHYKAKEKQLYKPK